jgi:16S rRNA (guanine527-N7)-methyltransferase
VPRERGESLEPLFDAFPALLERRATDQERARFERYADLLLRWNRTHNLTGLRTAASIGKGLFLDSLLFRSMLPRGAGLRVVDIGAGAGIPGIPLRIVDPLIVLTLVESKRKPVSFLLSLVRELDLGDVAVSHGRAEDVVAQYPDLVGKFDVALSRAVGSLPRLLPVAMKYLRPGGVFVASGPPSGSKPNSPGLASALRWRTINYESLGISRLFGSAEKPS